MDSINVQCGLSSTGYGVCGLNTVLALERAGAQPAVWPIGGVEISQEQVDDVRRMIGRQKSYNKNAPSLRIWHQFDLAAHIGKGLHCSWPIFELDRLKPAEKHHLKQQDIVFATSSWYGQVLIENGIDADKIEYAPLGIDPNIFYPRDYDQKPSHEQTMTGNPTVFLNVGKWEYRKGHDILVEAFCKAFTKNDNVLLVMHCYNPCFQDPNQGRSYNDQWCRLYKLSALGDKIRIVNGRLSSHHEVANLMAQADCGVFPARAEGWNLELLEMMAMGKTVIATDYSAHTEYCTENNALLIDVGDSEEAHDGVWFRADDPVWEGQPGMWARLGRSEIDQLVQHMRGVHKAKQEGCLAFNKAGVATGADYTWNRTANEILSVLR